MKEQIVPPEGPRPAGPYSPAIRANGFVFVSGQTPVNPKTGEVLRGPIQDQVRQVLENLETILTAAGSSLRQAVKTTVYLSDIGDFKAMNEAYASYFGDTPPARTTIQAARLPLDVGIEIDVIAMA